MLKSDKLSLTVWLNSVYAILGTIAGLLLVRFVMKLVNLESSNPVAGLVYGITGWMVTPAKSLLKVNNEALPGAIMETYTMVTFLAVAVSGMLLGMVAAALKQRKN